MNLLEEIANSIYLPEIPFQQNNTTFQEFLNAYVIKGIKLNAPHKIEENDNPEFQLQIFHEGKIYLLAIKLEEIKKPSEYKKRLESQIINPYVNGAIVLTSLTLNKTIRSYLRRFPVEIKVIDYLQRSNVRRRSPISGSQIIRENPETELLNLSKELEDTIENFKEKRINRKRFYKTAERVKSRLQFLGWEEKYSQILDTAYRLLTKKVEDKKIQVKKSKEINFAELIGNEKVTLTDNVLTFNEQMREINPDYFIFWGMEKKKTIWNKGIIVLVDNPRIYDSFRKALEEKYEIKMPPTKSIDSLINHRVEKARKFQYRTN